MATPQPHLISPDDSELYKQILSHLRNNAEYILNAPNSTVFMINNVKPLTGDLVEPLWGAKEVLYGNNGETKEFVRIVKETAVGSGVFAGTKYALTGISMPALSALAIPAFGIAGGKLLYDTAPDFWNARAEELKSFGLMVGDFVMGLFDGEEEETILPEATLTNIRNSIPVYSIENNYSLTVKSNLDKNNQYYTSFNSPDGAKYADSLLLFENISSITYKPGLHALRTITYQHASSMVSVKIHVITGGKHYEYGFLIMFNYDHPLVGQEYTVYDDGSSETRDILGIWSLWNMPNNRPHHRIYVQSMQIYSTEINPTTLEPVNPLFVNPIQQYSPSKFFDGTDPYTVAGNFNSAFSLYNLVPIVIECAKGYEFKKGVIIPDHQTLTENYPEWKTNALDAVNSALQKGFAIGINPITNPALSPLEQQQQQQNPSPMSPSTITPEQWEQLIKIITQTITENVTTPNPNPNPDTQPQPNPQPLPNPNPDDIGDPPEPPDPNKPAEPGDIPILPLLPSSMRSNALFTVYNPSISQLNALGAFLWSIWNGTNPIENIIDIFKKIWQNPLDGVISLTRVYSHIPQGSTHSIYLGAIDSGVDAPVVSSQFVTQNMGSVPIAEILKNVTDYSPYCSINVYLPFIGYIEVDSDDFMDGSMNIEYTIDIWTGACLATIFSTRTPDMPNKTPLYTFSGNVCQQIPLTSMSANGIMSGLVSATAGLLTGASGGALATLAANTVSHQLVHVSRSGSISGNSGIMGSKTPGVVISRRNSYNANAYNTLYGFPSNKTVYLKNCKGFTKVKSIHLKSYASSAEKEEIVELLKKGVII